MIAVMPEAWPALPYSAWKDTAATLQLWMQVAGKVRLALTPWLNHSWHVTLRVTARGLATPLIGAGDRDFQMEFDFLDHVLAIRSADEVSRSVKLRPVSVATFHAETMAALAALGVRVEIDDMPNEIPDAIPFREDRVHASYDPAHAQAFWRVLLRAHEVFSHFRTGFLGKASPVHFFWGSFDLAVTRFSGRPAPLHPGGIPHLPDAVVREAYSHEVSSAGFWPGGGLIEYPAFYSYAYPVPQGFSDAPVLPAGAFFSRELGEFLLPYDAVRIARDPKQMLMDFLQSTYAAAADLARWDRAALECGLGHAGVPRPLV